MFFLTLTIAMEEPPTETAESGGTQWGRQGDSLCALVVWLPGLMLETVVGLWADPGERP